MTSESGPGMPTPIVDAHAHIFPSLRSGSARAVAERGRFWQYHLQDCPFVWRKHDGHPAPTVLQTFGDRIDDLPDIGFRFTDFGQAECSIDGIDYVIQLYAPSLVGMESPPQRLVGEMNLAGVSMALIHADHVYGDLNEFVGHAMRAFPGRFAGLAQIWEPEGGSPEQIARLDEAITVHRLAGLYFSTEAFEFAGVDYALDDHRFDPLWARVKELDVPIFWYIEHRAPQHRVERFQQRVAELGRWADRFPDVVSVLTHGVAPSSILRNGGYPVEVINLMHRPNMHAEILFPSLLGEYPYERAAGLLRDLRDELGADKLLWGSDSPLGLTFWCTYPQALDFIRIHAGFLSQSERAGILGGNAMRVLRIDRDSATPKIG